MLQLLGIGCFWFSHHPFSAASSFLWGTGFVALFPGDVLGGWIVEKLFWHSRLWLVSMGLMSALFMVAIMGSSG
jgi:hypothetical protein